MDMLPVVPIPASPTLRPMTGKQRIDPWPDSPDRKPALRLRALVVEDQEADVLLAVRVLRESGFDVETEVVQDEEHFLEQVRKSSYDVVLADYNLPQWNGMEAVGLLRRERLDIPLILVTGSLGEVKAVECLKEGAADYVLKEHLTRLPESIRQAVREKKLREENRRNQEELARSNRDLEQFAYVASHDLQEPLRMIAAYTQLLSERYRGKLDKDADKYIDYVIDGAMRMQALIEGLLAFSRVGRHGIELQSADCNMAVEMAKKNLDAAMRESGAAVKHEALPVIVADSALLVQVFQNLMGNSIKFHGAQPPVISIGAEKAGQEWIFSVTDNGIGIAAEHAQAIFAIFKRLHTHAEYPGSGIGLSICKKIIEQHGGRIWVESLPGQGSTFKFTVPVLLPRKKHEALP